MVSGVAPMPSTGVIVLRVSGVPRRYAVRRTSRGGAEALRPRGPDGQYVWKRLTASQAARVEWGALDMHSGDA